MATSNHYDAIVILGGGLRNGGELPPWSEARFDLALENQSGNECFLCLSQATVHRPPPIDERGFPIAEAAVGGRYLVERGIHPDRVRLEALSIDTVGNAAFTRLLHADPAGWRNLLIITSAFHMPRTRAIFEAVFSLTPSEYQLEFAESENRGVSSDAAAARAEREQRSLDQWKRTATQWKSLREFTDWLWTRHDAYSTEGLIKTRPPLDKQTMESY